MEIPLTEDWLKQLYQVLIRIYNGTDDPIKTGYPIVSDCNEAMLNVCVKRPHTKIFGRVIYPHVLQRAAVNMHSIINFHPFVDGNKRMALLSTYYYLLWNGYTFNIPSDADEFTVKVARERLELNEILSWLIKNTSRSWLNVFRQWLCGLDVSEDGTIPTSKVFVNDALIFLFLPRDGFIFFRDKIVEERRKRGLVSKP